MYIAVDYSPISVIFQLPRVVCTLKTTMKSRRIRTIPLAGRYYSHRRWKVYKCPTGENRDGYLAHYPAYCSNICRSHLSWVWNFSNFSTASSSKKPKRTRTPALYRFEALMRDVYCFHIDDAGRCTVLSEPLSVMHHWHVRRPRTCNRIYCRTSSGWPQHWSR